LFGVRSGFDVFDTLLKFLLIDLVEKFSSFDEEEVIKIVNGSTVSGVACDFVTIGEQSVEFFVQKGTNVGGVGSGTHKTSLFVNISVKITRFGYCTTPQKFLHTP